MEADRELPEILRRYGRGAKRLGMMQEQSEDARWFAELHAFLDMAAIEIESLRASLLARHRDGERESDKWFVPVVSSAPPTSPPAASEPTEGASHD